jgi:hypothetical protein
MTTLAQAVERQFNALNSVTLKAAPIETATDHLMRKKGYEAVLPSWCVCVTEPCNCSEPDGPIIWILTGDIRSRSATKLENRSGDKLIEYVLNREANVVCEKMTTIAAGELKPAGKRNFPIRTGPNQYMRNGPGSSYSGQECGGGTLFDVWTESDGQGGTVFYYVAVGSC